MDLHDLNDATRAAMIEEAEADIKARVLYMSRRLNDRGTSRWPQVLLDALRSGDPASLATRIQAEALLVSREIAYRNGKPYERKVPANAAEILAEGEFVRFYMRAVCIQALDLSAKIRVYRAKLVTNPRPESGVKIGSIVNPAELLEDLRRNIGVDTFLGLPSGPNSGLCVRLT